MLNIASRVPRRAVALAVALAVAGPGYGQNLILNGDFESGFQLSNWTVPASPTSASLAYIAPIGSVACQTISMCTRVAAFSGDYSASFITISAIEQSVAVMPGTMYLFRYRTKGATSFGQSIGASFSTLTTLPRSQVDVADVVPGWVVHTSYVTATTSASTVRFAGGPPQGSYLLDDVSLTAVAAVAAPEPASIALLGAGLVVVAGVMRRRRA